VADEIETGQEFLEKYGLSGLSSIIAAAIVKAGQAGPRAKKILFQKTIHEVCRTALEAGIEPTDLFEAAMTILEVSNQEIARLRKALEAKKLAKAEAKAAEIEKALTKRGL